MRAARNYTDLGDLNTVHMLLTVLEKFVVTKVSSTLRPLCSSIGLSLNSGRPGAASTTAYNGQNKLRIAVRFD